MSIRDLPDEPTEMGAVIRVHNPHGNYPEIWVASNINIGAWYPDQETYLTAPGVKQFIADHDNDPDYWHVAERGRVELLTVGDRGAYKEGWRAGCRAAAQAAEELEYQMPAQPAQTATQGITPTPRRSDAHSHHSGPREAVQGKGGEQ